MLKQSIKVVFGFTVFFAGYAMADTTTVCANGSEERTVAIVYTSPGNQMPCEVRYTKGGQTRVLWDAKTESGYCESKATEFVSKLVGWGYTCNELVADQVVEPAPAAQ